MTKEKLSPQAFFSLENYAHAELFAKCAFAWEALGYLAAYLESPKKVKIESEIPPSVALVNPSLISIGKGCTIEEGAYIRGPCILGDHCQVRQGAYIRGFFVAGKRCVIGHDTEVKHSIFLDDVHAAHFNYVGDSILGNGVNLGAGAKCANVRFDNRYITLFIEGEKWVTNVKKMGLIAGDGAQVGCNGVTNPGTLLGRDALCYPCLNVGGYIPPGSRVKSLEKTIKLGI